MQAVWTLYAAFVNYFGLLAPVLITLAVTIPLCFMVATLADLAPRAVPHVKLYLLTTHQYIFGSSAGLDWHIARDLAARYLSGETVNLRGIN